MSGYRDAFEPFGAPYDTHTPVDSVESRLAQAIAERDASNARLREVAQTLIERVGADGPMSALDAALRTLTVLDRTEANIAERSIVGVKIGQALGAKSGENLIDVAKRVVAERDAAQGELEEALACEKETYASMRLIADQRDAALSECVAARADVERLTVERDDARGQLECDDCNGSGWYFIDGARQRCICLDDRVDSGTCAYAGPGRGDCEHAVGLPGMSIPGQHDGTDTTVDLYNRPNGWCWHCWLMYSRDAAREDLHKAERERDAARYELEAEREEGNQIVAAMNQAEDERDAARAVLRDIAEGDCSYGDGCPKFGSRHGQCVSCKAREALGDKVPDNKGKD